MKKIFLLFILASFFSCSTAVSRFNEVMLPDGTWKLAFNTTNQCHENGEAGTITVDPRKAFDKDLELTSSIAKDQKSCLEFYKTQATQRGRELCPSDKFRVFGCMSSQEAESFSLKEKVVCYLKCQKEI